MATTPQSTQNKINAMQRRGLEADLLDKQKVYVFDDKSHQFQLMRADLRSNESIEARYIEIHKADPTDIINNYIHKLPKTVRNSIKPQTLFFHFTSEDFNRFNIEEQRIQIKNLYPNFLIF